MYEPKEENILDRHPLDLGPTRPQRPPSEQAQLLPELASPDPGSPVLFTFTDGQGPTPMGRLSQNAADGHFAHELEALVAHEGEGLSRQVQPFVQDLVAVLRQPWIVTCQGLLS